MAMMDKVGILSILAGFGLLTAACGGEVKCGPGTQLDGDSCVALQATPMTPTTPEVDSGLTNPPVTTPDAGTTIPTDPDAGTTIPTDPDAGIATPVDPDAGLVNPPTDGAVVMSTACDETMGQCTTWENDASTMFAMDRMAAGCTAAVRAPQLDAVAQAYADEQAAAKNLTPSDVTALLQRAAMSGVTSARQGALFSQTKLGGADIIAGFRTMTGQGAEIYGYCGAYGIGIATGADGWSYVTFLTTSAM